MSGAKISTAVRDPGRTCDLAAFCSVLRCNCIGMGVHDFQGLSFAGKFDRPLRRRFCHTCQMESSPTSSDSAPIGLRMKESKALEPKPRQKVLGVILEVTLTPHPDRCDKVMKTID